MNSPLPNVAITIKQPWATLIVLGIKDIENRTWSTKFRGPVLIHASKRKEDEEWNSAKDLIQLRKITITEKMKWRDYPSGGVIGVAEIVDCVHASASPWFVGEFGFVLANARPLPFHACRGALGFWKCEYPADLLSQ